MQVRDHVGPEGLLLLELKVKWCCTCQVHRYDIFEEISGILQEDKWKGIDYLNLVFVAFPPESETEVRQVGRIPSTLLFRV